MRGIEVSQHTARRTAAPAQLRAAEHAIEVGGIQTLEDFLQVEMFALGSGDELAAADLLDQVRLPAYIAAIEVKTVAMSVDARDRLAVEFAEEDVGQSFQYRRRRTRQQV